MSKVIDPLTDEQLEEWAEALESGKYEQGDGDLYLDGKFCCLGVLAEIRGELDHTNGWFTRTGEGGNLAQGYRTLAGSVYYLARDQQNSLAASNDRGVTFPEIATRIRQELIGKGGAS